jgi:hypothetical protein
MSVGSSSRSRPGRRPVPRSACRPAATSSAARRAAPSPSTTISSSCTTRSSTSTARKRSASSSSRVAFRAGPTPATRRRDGALSRCGRCPPGRCSRSVPAACASAPPPFDPSDRPPWRSAGAIRGGSSCTARHHGGPAGRRRRSPRRALRSPTRAPRPAGCSPPCCRAPAARPWRSSSAIRSTSSSAVSAPSPRSDRHWAGGCGRGVCTTTATPTRGASSSVSPPTWRPSATPSSTTDGQRCRRSPRSCTPPVA